MSELSQLAVKRMKVEFLKAKLLEALIAAKDFDSSAAKDDATTRALRGIASDYAWELQKLLQAAVKDASKDEFDDLVWQLHRQV